MTFHITAVGFCIGFALLGGAVNLVDGLKRVHDDDPWCFFSLPVGVLLLVAGVFAL